MPTQIPAAGIAPGAVTADKIASGAVTAEKVEGGSLGSTGPKITAVQVTDSAYTVLDDTAVDLAGGYIKIIGSGFESGCSVVIGTTAATSTTFISATEVRAQVPAQSAGSYFVYVINTDGGTATRINGLTYSASPVWITASALANATTNVAYTYNLSATGATNYSLQEGSSLPAGATLTSGGTLSGTTVVANDTAYSFTVVASDNENQDSPRTFNLSVLAIGFTTATGGTVTTDGDYKIHTFTTNGTFEVSSVGNPDNNIEYLIVGGGGSGGGSSYFDVGGGGGGGGFVTGNTSATVGSFNVVVGAGGSNQAGLNDGDPSLATSGGTRGGKPSSWNGITAYGGGAGSHGNQSTGYPGASGGGAGGNYGGGRTGGTGNRQNAPNALTAISGPVQGYNGGNSASNGSTYDYGRGGGGGGAGSAASGTTGGNGRLFYGIYYGGGGGGGAGPNETPGTGGAGGGGEGARASGTNGTNGRGGGGGGSGQGSGYNSLFATSGGSGVVIIRYRYK